MAVATRRRRGAAQPTLRFDERLVLHRYMLSLFGVETFEQLAVGLKKPEYELTDEENTTQIVKILAARFPDREQADPPGPGEEDLLRYDANIVRHTRRIEAGRGEPIRWKYFQYLALLFTEMYLDRYFTDPEALRRELNAYVERFNDETAATEADEVERYDREDVHKLALWMATGSGKTLLMHVNILQYLHYLERHGRRDELNRIILLTPNEGLSTQHLGELRRSGIGAELFDKNAGRMFTGQAVEIIDVHKLGEEMGEKTVAVDAFEGNNLVLVDEGHRGAGGFEWKDKRDRLCADGFSFEYSATFGQAVKAANKPELTQQYAKCILFDYSYRYFYNDRYGKDYQILNLDSSEEDKQHRYLTASLLAFYQQLLAYEERSDAFAPYGLERPLWIFVGGSVTAGTSARERSDIEEILSFLMRFIRNREESVELLDRLMSGRTGITYNGRDVFGNKYAYLARKRMNGEALYDSIRERVFSASSGTQLRVEELKGSQGELALRIGDHEPFGVINVGDAGGLRRLLESREELRVGTNEFAGSLFDELNEPTSRVNLLIGSKKFTEGWNSWRVSSMGLMNIGRTEGAQIIQLFGRGVRLRGLGGGLQRSAVLTGRDHPEDIRLLETLNVYGVRADYMEKFKEYLAEEGLPPNEGKTEIIVPVKRWIPDHPLKSIRIAGGRDFKRDAPRPTLGPPPQDFLTRPIPLDWYAKVQALASGDVGDSSAVVETRSLEERHVAFMDLDRIHFELVAYKNERGRHNLTMTRQQVGALLRDPSWYQLKIPAAEMEFPTTGLMRRVRMWEEIALALLKKYVDRYYKAKREEWEAPLREYYTLEPSDANFLKEYRFEVTEAQEALSEKLREAKWLLEADMFDERAYGCLGVFEFDRHLYKPLVHATGDDLKVVPTALNEGERDFVKDLRRFYESRPDFFADKKLYLLRNLARLGVGFFEAGNFYPDFILWLLVSNQQYVTFIDPKGIARMTLDDPKIEFYRTVKNVERAMGDPTVTLNSFIVSNTRYGELSRRGISKEEYEASHVLFQKDDKESYIERMLRTW